ncbi:hypothetical protein [Streptomyces sp. NPDC056468]|uniref:hypothetical protein n=1 Tax=Streptomyces sp. NPDC056468 TaxID=3345830 RepID=UPI003683962E
MGFVIWYRVAFLDAENAAPSLRVSNDAVSGEFAVEADVTVTSWSGPHAEQFTVVLYDLPLEHGERLALRHRRSASAGPLLVDIRLGYLDRPDQHTAPVLLGAVTSVRARVSDDGELLTEVHGQGLVGHRLLRTPFHFGRSGDTPLAELALTIGERAGVTVVDGGVTGTRPDPAVRTTTSLSALGEVAAAAGVDLVVRDARALLGTAVADGPPVLLEPGTNIVRQGRTDDEPDSAAGAVRGHQLTVLGDPALRAGGTVLLASAGAPEPVPLRLAYVRHRFGKDSGYVCDLVAAPQLPGADGRRTGAAGVGDLFRGMVRTTLADHPAVDVGDVVATRPGSDDPGQRATLAYGQPPASDASAPVVDDPLQDDPPHLHDRPVAAPFAWDRCGLVVPVYPGMRAVLAHNRGAVDDAVVSGFVWSGAAGHRPPAAEQGDYWLCLPTEVRDGRPAGKGVNDLTDSTGRRVLQARGLSITVAEQQLPEVGSRPEVPDELTLVISHEKGTTITVAADGAVNVTTSGKDIVLGNGQASITLSGSRITLHAQSVEVT